MDSMLNDGVRFDSLRDSYSCACTGEQDRRELSGARETALITPSFRVASVQRAYGRFHSSHTQHRLLSNITQPQTGCEAQRHFGEGDK